MESLAEFSPVLGAVYEGFLELIYSDTLLDLAERIVQVFSIPSVLVDTLNRIGHRPEVSQGHIVHLQVFGDIQCPGEVGVSLHHPLPEGVKALGNDDPRLSEVVPGRIGNSVVISPFLVLHVIGDLLVEFFLYGRRWFKFGVFQEALDLKPMTAWHREGFPLDTGEPAHLVTLLHYFECRLLGHVSHFH